MSARDPIAVMLYRESGTGYVQFAEGEPVRSVWLDEIAKVEMLADGTIAGIVAYAVTPQDTQEGLAQWAVQQIERAQQWPGWPEAYE